MGCCVSTNNTSPPPKTPHISNSSSSTKQNGNSESPPPTYPLPEEETVKEVLSETPTIPKHPSPPIPRFHENHQNESQFKKTADQKKHHQNGTFFKKPFMAFGNDELSEVSSEICSTLSENVSVSTTITEKRENNGDGNDEFRETQWSPPVRFMNRSFSGDVKREKTVGKSPGRRSEPSPSRNGPGSSYGRRKDSGESSGRRSRSPVMRTDKRSSKTGLGGSQSSRKTDKSPGRVGSGSGEGIRKVDEGKESEGITWPPTSNELLENPLVSLECFIFL
ncbi:hypothetical protein Pfo_023325 [Paulownia fortunei]|nr:hypothetical protein Pfo_023325 [Paulownia fortunei]